MLRVDVSLSLPYAIYSRHTETEHSDEASNTGLSFRRFFARKHLGSVYLGSVHQYKGLAVSSNNLYFNTYE